MSGKRQQSPRDPTQTLAQTIRRPDLSILGGSITTIPLAQWREKMLFRNVPDTDLRAMTGSFPARLKTEKDTHPIFTLRCHPAGHFVCPCSSMGSPTKQRYIREGCTLLNSGKVMDRDAFLIESCAFTLPLDHRFSRKIYYMGTVPGSCLVDEGATS